MKLVGEDLSTLDTVVVVSMLFCMLATWNPIFRWAAAMGFHTLDLWNCFKITLFSPALINGKKGLKGNCSLRGCGNNTRETELFRGIPMEVNFEWLVYDIVSKTFLSAVCRHIKMGIFLPIFGSMWPKAWIRSTTRGSRVL